MTRRKLGNVSATFDQACQIALRLPGVEAATSYGTPSLKVKGRFMARLREPDVMVLTPVDDIEQQFLMETRPQTYFTTDHYRGYPAILIRLSTVPAADLRDLIENAWRRLAPKKLLAMYDAGVDR